MTNLRLITLVIGTSLAACSAPHGKKLAANQTLAPVATGPALKTATLSWENKGEVVTLQRGGTVTTLLESTPKDGYGWRLSATPDSTVLKLVSKEYVAPASPGEHGKEKWVFQSVGTGDADVKFWYGSLHPTDFL